MSAPEQVIVGVDGSEGSRHALEFAVREAGLRSTSLRAVSTWHVPWSVQSGAPGLDAGLIISGLRANAQEALRGMVAAVASTAEGVDIVSDVREGRPAEVLVELSAAASLLVVGSRGIGGFRGLVLGSVSHQCAQHAACPVAIVPPLSRN